MNTSNDLNQALADYLQLSETGWDVIKGKVNYSVFDNSSNIIHKGQNVSGAYLVLSGQLRVYTYTPQGQEATLYLIKPGETCVLALNCLFNNLRYPAWVESSPNTNVAMIPGPLYKTLFQSEKNIQDMTVTALSTLVFRLMNEIEQIHSFTVSQRLANFLLNNANADGEVKMTQQQLAGHLGSSREVVARAIQKLNADGLICTKRGMIIINDINRLRES